MCLATLDRGSNTYTHDDPISVVVEPMRAMSAPPGGPVCFRTNADGADANDVRADVCSNSAQSLARSAERRPEASRSPSASRLIAGDAGAFAPSTSIALTHSASSSGVVARRYPVANVARDASARAETTTARARATSVAMMRNGFSRASTNRVPQCATPSMNAAATRARLGATTTTTTTSRAGVSLSLGRGRVARTTRGTAAAATDDIDGSSFASAPSARRARFSRETRTRARCFERLCDRVSRTLSRTTSDARSRRWFWERRCGGCDSARRREDLARAPRSERSATTTRPSDWFCVTGVESAVPWVGRRRAWRRCERRIARRATAWTSTRFETPSTSDTCRGRWTAATRWR